MGLRDPIDHTIARLRKSKLILRPPTRRTASLSFPSSCIVLDFDLPICSLCSLNLPNEAAMANTGVDEFAKYVTSVQGYAEAVACAQHPYSYNAVYNLEDQCNGVTMANAVYGSCICHYDFSLIASSMSSDAVTNSNCGTDGGATATNLFTQLCSTAYRDAASITGGGSVSTGKLFHQS